MASKKKSKTKGKKGGLSSHQNLVAGAAGAIVGGTIGAAMGVVMTDEKIREKAVGAAANLRDMAQETVNQAQEIAPENAKQLSNKTPKTLTQKAKKLKS